MEELELTPPLRLFKGDRQRLQEYYPKAGYNRIIRELVRRHLAKLDAKVEQRMATKGLTADGLEFNINNGGDNG